MLDSGLFVSSNGFACSFEKTINEVVALFLVVFIFGSSSDYQCVQVNETNADTPYSKSYIMFRLSVLDQFFGISSCYVEKMTADEQFGRVETTSQYLRMPSFTGRKKRMKMRVEPGSQKPPRPKFLLLQSLDNGFCIRSHQHPFPQ